jgi:hypothetical protein
LETTNKKVEFYYYDEDRSFEEALLELVIIKIISEMR